MEMLSVAEVTKRLYGLITMAMMVSMVLSLFLYYKSLRASHNELSATGNTGTCTKRIDICYTYCSVIFISRYIMISGFYRQEMSYDDSIIQIMFCGTL